jgi:hypothetical protein
VGENERSGGYLVMASTGAGVAGVGLPVVRRSSGEVPFSNLLDSYCMRTLLEVSICPNFCHNG